MISANKIIDTLITAKKRGIPVGVNDPMQLIESIRSSIKFDGGDANNLPKSESDMAPRLPFDQIYVEMSDGKNPSAFLATVTEGFEWEAVIFLMIDGRLQPAGITMTSELDSSGRFRYLANGSWNALDDGGMSSESLSFIGTSFLWFLNVINCSNITYVDNVPSNLKQRRVKMGKTPLFTYKTLHVKTSRVEGRNIGDGQHASPRVHLRRGHIRNHPTAGNVWVQPCVVGDKSKGMVLKDYSVNQR